MTTLFETIVTKTKPVHLRMLAEGKVGARLATFANGTEAIVKIATSSSMKNDRSKQRDLPTKDLPQREVAFYRLAKLFGFSVVPETILGEVKGYKASFQQYVTSAKLYDVEPLLRKPANKEGWIIALRETLRDKVPLEDTLHLTLLDFLAASRDRHGANYGAKLDVSGGKARWRLVGWDNGCAFGLTQKKYHCVAHKYLFRYAFDLSPVWDVLKSIKRSDLVSSLHGLIDDEAIDHVWIRVQFAIMFPHRMPWVVLSKGIDDPDAFPSYEEVFTPMVSRPLYFANPSWSTAHP